MFLLKANNIIAVGVVKREQELLRDVRRQQRKMQTSSASGYTHPCGTSVMNRWSSILTSQQGCQDVQTCDLTSPLHVVTSNAGTRARGHARTVRLLQQWLSCFQAICSSVCSNPVIRADILSTITGSKEHSTQGPVTPEAVWAQASLHRPTELQ